MGTPVAGRARVGEVVADRGFWLEQDGARIFAVIADTPQAENAATAVRIPGGQEPETTQIIASEPAFLYVSAQNVIPLGPENG